MCWNKAEIVPGRHPERWRKDAAGNIVFKRFHSCQGCLCFEFDHIIPFSKGGQSVPENCQILQTLANRLKSDKEVIGINQLKGYSCDINFSDEELDLIELAVYGNVLRAGRQCRSKIVDEMLGKYKSRNKMAACNSIE